MKSRQLALVIAGPALQCPMRKLPRLAEHLGPVMAASYRQASRTANTLRAGQAVRDCAGLAAARTILLCPSRRPPGGLIAQLAAADLRWKSKSVILCDNLHDSGELAALAARGASVGALCLVDDAAQPLFLVEGAARAVRDASAFVEAAGGRVLAVNPGCQWISVAGISSASWLAMLAMDCSVACFRQAGLAPSRAGQVTELILEKALRAFRKGGRRAWKLPVSPAEREAFLRQIEAVRESDEALAEFLADAARTSLGRLGADSAWLAQASRGRGRGAAGGVG